MNGLEEKPPVIRVYSPWPLHVWEMMLEMFVTVRTTSLVVLVVWFVAVDCVGCCRYSALAGDVGLCMFVTVANHGQNRLQKSRNKKKRNHLIGKKKKNMKSLSLYLGIQYVAWSCV